jgi:Arc/MetJ-type ribon-helix-helix transcriptional regulator
MVVKARIFGFGLGDKDCLKWLEDEVGTVGDEIKMVFDKMAKSQRDNVVMVRVDEETRNKLDAWVEAGAVKSRSEAAALFIREGLKVRQAELEKLEESLRDLQTAKERVREKAREVFGDRGEAGSTT